MHSKHLKNGSYFLKLKSALQILQFRPQLMQTPFKSADYLF